MEQPCLTQPIIIEKGRIAAVGPSSIVVQPPDVRTFDVGGRTVVPGFIDMHYHVTTGAMRYRRTRAGALDSTYERALAERLLRVALSRGITTLRDPGASPITEAVSLRNDVRNGRVLGPRIFTAGPILASSRLSADEIRSSIRMQAKAGVDYIKLYSGITLPQLRVAVDEAHRHGLKVIGHLQRTSWTDAALNGIDFITHAGSWHDVYLPPSRRDAYAALGSGMQARIAWLEWLDVNSPAIDSMIRALKEHRVSIDPTLVAYHTKFWCRDSLYQQDPDSALVPEVLANWRVLGMPTAGWTPQEFARAQAAWPKLLALVRRLYRSGVLLTVGSDVASPWVTPGVSFHQELELLTSAGLSPLQALGMATRDGAQALGLLGDVGTVERGKRADLVILDGNPLEDIRNTRRIHSVLLGGTIHRPEDLMNSPQRLPP